jgi:hypothetical protein
MEDIAEDAGAWWSRFSEEPASPPSNFNVDFHVWDAVQDDDTNWPEGPGFTGFQEIPLASDYSPTQQGSGGALAEADFYDFYTTNDLSLVGTESIYDYGSHLDVSNPVPSTPTPTPGSTPALTFGAPTPVTVRAPTPVTVRAPTPVTVRAPTPQSQASSREGLSPLAIGRNPNPSRQVSLPHKTHSS